MRTSLALGLLLGLAVAQARDIPYGAVPETVQRCDTLNWGGRDAKPCYQGLLREAAATAAEGAWALGDFKGANDLFRQAVAAHPRDAALRVRWGELYLDTHQQQDALQLFQEALKLDGANAFAKVGAAGVLSDEYAPQAGQYLDAVLNDASAPAGARLRALLLKARAALEDGELASAQQQLDAATAVAGAARLTQLQIEALRAAEARLRGESDERWVQQALAEDAHFGDIYAVPAQYYVFTRRQREAIVLYQKAVDIEPTLWSAQVGLASCLLRENRITEARAHLEAAYRGDPFDPITINTLRLLDSLNQFDVLVYPEAARSSAAAPTLILRLHKKESAVLAPYARRLAEQAMATYSERYHFMLKQPVVIEIYPDHADFAVRTAGMPGIGLLGVTFGYVVAMDSPSSRPLNEFHWGTTLWHEMAHVFTLESTDHRVPRWLSEGLSVFEEWRTGPIRGMEIPDYVFAALAQGKALPVVDLDHGFVRPDYPQQVQVSYMQAGLSCDFIDRAFGFDKLLALLAAYKHTADTAVAVHEALGISAAEFDARFQADLKQQFGPLLTHIDAWQSARALTERDAGMSDWPGVLENAPKALALLAQDVEDGSPYVALASAYAATGRAELARSTLEQYWRRGGHDPRALKDLAHALHQAQHPAEAVAVLESVNYVAPFDYDLHGELGDWLLALNRNAEALAEYQAAMALNPPDLAQAHYRLAQAEYALQAVPEARRQVLAALEQAPNFEPAQQLLLKISHSTP